MSKKVVRLTESQLRLMIFQEEHLILKNVWQCLSFVNIRCLTTYILCVVFI